MIEVVLRVHRLLCKQERITIRFRTGRAELVFKFPSQSRLAVLNAVSIRKTFGSDDALCFAALAARYSGRGERSRTAGSCPLRAAAN